MTKPLHLMFHKILGISILSLHVRESSPNIVAEFVMGRSRIKPRLAGFVSVYLASVSLRTTVSSFSSYLILPKFSI